MVIVSRGCGKACRILAEVGVLAFVAGCGAGGTYPVSGWVLLADGRPVRAGQIEFRSLDRPISAIGALRPDGSFELSLRATGDGALAGAYAVALVEPAPPPGVPSQEAEEAPLAEARREWLADVPRRYRSTATSGLSFEVKPDRRANAFQIVLEP